MQPRVLSMLSEVHAGPAGGQSIQGGVLGHGSGSRSLQPCRFGLIEMRAVRRVVHPSDSTAVRDLMSRTIVNGDPRHTLVEAAAEMRLHRVSALPVLDNGGIVGIITERDLLRAIADGRDPSETDVSQYMTHSPRTIEASVLAADAAAVMVRHRVRHLPVTQKGKLVGFQSARDLLSLAPWPKELPVGEPW